MPAAQSHQIQLAAGHCCSDGLCHHQPPSWIGPNSSRNHFYKSELQLSLQLPVLPQFGAKLVLFISMIASFSVLKTHILILSRKIGFCFHLYPIWATVLAFTWRFWQKCYVWEHPKILHMFLISMTLYQHGFNYFHPQWASSCEETQLIQLVRFLSVYFWVLWDRFFATAFAHLSPEGGASVGESFKNLSYIARSCLKNCNWPITKNKKHDLAGSGTTLHRPDSAFIELVEIHVSSL